MRRKSAETIAQLERDTFGYFVHEANPANGLIADNTRYGSPASIAAVGLGLSCYPVGVERGYLRRAEAAERTLTTLRFFARSPQGPEPESTGHRGFYYHFLDMQRGLRAMECELSTIDSAILLAGMLCAAVYFEDGNAGEREIRRLAHRLYRRADWRWALNRSHAVTHGWRPETGFLPYHWLGYTEALILYVLGLGSPTHALPARSYAAWTATYRWRRIYGRELLYAGPLFVHQLSQVWLDLRGIRDPYMRARGSDYFENTRRATHVQQEYARRNRRRFRGYGELCWGITAGDGPGDFVRRIRGVRRHFHGYLGRGVPFGPDDGTLSPWAVVASLPFAPEIVVPTIEAYQRTPARSEYGFLCSLNPTFPSDAPGDAQAGAGWVAKGYYGLDQGPVVLMIENYRSGLVWRLMRACPYVVTGLLRAGFSGGWLARRSARVR